MAARIGIELSATTCRIIEIDDGPAWKRDPFATRVLSFVSRPLTDPELAERLAALRGRSASVVVWTPHSNHRLVTVAEASYDRMRAEARAIVGVASPEMPRLLSDIAPAAPHVAGMDRRTVLVASVPRSEVTGALRPLDEAGIQVHAVLTPASALASLARMRRPLDGPAEALEAYVAIEERASTIALVRGGVLLAARTMPWGFLTAPPAHYVVRAREEIATRLARDLSECLASGHLGSMPLAQVCMCGGLPELRSMTVALMERLDVEVETLDSLFGLDTELPEPVEEFRERSAELRMAWAAASDRRPLLDLFRQRKRLSRSLVLSTAAIAAGVAAGIAVTWVWHAQWIHPVGSTLSRPVGPSEAPDSKRAVLPPFPVPALAPVTVFSSPPRPPLASPPTQAAGRALDPPTRRSVEPPVAASADRPVEEQIEKALIPPVQPALEPGRVEQFLPFEATLVTILYSPDRKLAIVDGRIVQAGDEVRGARIVEITPTSVYLRDAQGQLRRLTAGGAGR